MWFWWFMFVCDMLIPVTFIICGKMMQRQASEKMSGRAGYRTKCSMRNAETWKFANEHCGRLWWRIGWCMLPLSALVHLPFIHSSTGTIGTMGGILCAIQTSPGPDLSSPFPPVSVSVPVSESSSGISSSPGPLGSHLLTKKGALQPRASQRHRGSFKSRGPQPSDFPQLVSHILHSSVKAQRSGDTG